MLDFKNIEDLTRFQNEINKVINEHINKCKQNESIETIPSLNYMKLINLMESTIPSLVNKKGGLKLIKNYIKLVKESTSLKPMYELYKLVNRSHSYENSDLLLSEALTCAKNNINKETMCEDTNKLSNVVIESIKLSNLDNETINTIINEDNTIISSLQFLLENNKKMNNLDEYLENFSNVSKHINENIVKCENDGIEGNTKSIANELCEHINSEEKQWFRKLLEDISYMNLFRTNKSDLFETYKNSCINTINEIVTNTSDIETISKMKSMCESLNKKEYSKDTFTTDIIKLAELNNTLKEDI